MGNTSITIPETDISYSMDDRLRASLDEKVKGQLEKKDKDYVLVIDGKEGSGKSTLGLQIGKYVDPTLNLSRVVFDAEAFKDAILNAKKGQCVIYDEAFTGFSSRSSLSGINRALVSLMMQMRQKNLFVIIILPTFFLLDRYVALFRARTLLHVYESGGNRGYFRLYNSKLKKILYLYGKKDYTYNVKKAITRFKGRFYGKFALGDEKEEEKYRKKKDKALQDTQSTPMNAAQAKYKDQRDLLIWRLRKETKMSYRQLESYLEEWTFGMNHAQIRNICFKFGDKEEKPAVFKGINEENAEKSQKEEIKEEK